jgi:hypothetical protein
VSTRDGLAARETLLGEQTSETIGTIRMVVARREPLASERILAVRARETFAMPDNGQQRTSIGERTRNERIYHGWFL